MQRNANNFLSTWVSKADRKPLILNGARQIGKSWLVRNLGKNQFKNNFIELNFEKKPQLNQLFEQDFDVKRIVSEIELLENQSINKHTLLFFDEIQNCPKAIMALRYFFEDMPEIPVIAAGSLLEFQLQNIPFPVGRVELLEIFPMSFDEFLMATGNEKLATLLFNTKATISPIVEDKLYQELLNYFWVGGMPECVQHFANHKNYAQVRKIQEDLLYTYQQDFSKYNPLVHRDCLLDILSNISQNIGGQVIYTKLSERFKGPTIKKGVEVLSTAKIFRKVNNVSLHGLPFSVSGKQFKACFIDIGLLLCLSKVSFEALFYPQTANSNFTGAWAEQFVGQQLLANGCKPLYYWARTLPNSSAEVDFVVEQKGEITPIEVKSGKSGKLRSLHVLLSENSEIKKAIIFSKSQSGVEGKLHFLPIYWAGYRF
jgi:predicted AAA+ superfamily ATPase